MGAEGRGSAGAHRSRAAREHGTAVSPAFCVSRMNRDCLGAAALVDSPAASEGGARVTTPTRAGTWALHRLRHA
jgi:hypothetical protein